jgi:hypothetical protein
LLSASNDIVEQTLDHLREGGRARCETALLWLGRRSDAEEQIVEVFRPQQIVDVDYFRIPAEGMRALLVHLRQRRLHLLAQVHSHPELAFHSRADNQWAIVRHVGAASLVVPWFAARIRAETFLDDIAAFQLDQHDLWREVPSRSILTVNS